MANIHIYPSTSNQFRYAMTMLRNRQTSCKEFTFYADKATRYLVDYALDLLPVTSKTITTPTNSEYEGIEFKSKVCGVSILRAGESMERALRASVPSIRIGKILIQRDEETAMPKLFYCKLPEDIASRSVLLLDPMLATGGSAKMAISELKKVGVLEKKIIFVSLIAAPEGIQTLISSYPEIMLVIGQKDERLDSRKYIIPGCGDFGDRYFGTDFSTK